jgi:gliding motility-associated-like protein
MNDRILFVTVFILCAAFAKAQLGFCSGQSGTAIFTEDFGQGTTNGPALPPFVTSYTYVNSGVQDGQYTISSTMQQLGSFWNAPDHTGNQDGKMLIVNADFNAGIFYQTPISGLCENTPYEFSSWVINVLSSTNNPCTPNEIPIQVRFEIWDSTDTNLLSSGVMNPRISDPAPTWVKYGLTFTTASGQNSCILKLINEGVGGCGNDLAIDDISFQPCGDVTQILNPSGTNRSTICENDSGISVILSASTSTNVFSTPEYQWQISTVFTFTDIPGANGPTYTTPVLTADTSYRLKVAEDAINLNNSQCVNFSDIFEFREVIVHLAVPTSDPFVSCNGELVELRVTSSHGLEAYWYDSPAGGTLLQANATNYSTTLAGTYYVETRDISSGCISTSRVPVTYRVESSSLVNSEDFLICPEDSAVLDPQFLNGTFNWNTGDTTARIAVNTAGTYTCEVINTAGCSSTATFNVAVVERPVIDSLLLIGEELSINLQISGDFQFSIDGQNWTTRNTFDITTFLQVTARVRDQFGCEIVTQQFSRIQIPNYFTPNGDGFHDTFEIYGIDQFLGAKLEIFDRYGKLLAQINDLVVGWDGLYLNQPMPSSDYWYRLYYNGKLITGHFTLKR